MQCPKCGAENPDDTPMCGVCSYDLHADYKERPPKAKVSKTAVASAVLAGAAVFLSVFTNPVLAFLFALLGISAAITSIRQIKKARGRLIGKWLAIAVIIFSAAQVVVNYWRIDAVPIPDDYTISDLKSADPKYNQSYDLLISLADTDGEDGAAIGLSVEDVNCLKAINRLFDEGNYDEVCAGPESNKENILRIWENSKKGRDVIDQLSEFPEIVDLTEPKVEAKHDYIKNFRRLVYIYRAYVCLQSYQGNEDIALREFFKCYNIVRKLDVNARPLVVKLVCIGCFRRYIEVANFMINNPRTSSASLEYLSEHIFPFSEEKTSLRNSIIFEYLMFKNEFTKIKQKKMKHSPAFKLNSTLRVYRNFCDNWIAEVDGGTNMPEEGQLAIWPSVYPDLPVYIDQDGNIQWYYKAYNPIGSIFLIIVCPACDAAYQTSEKIQIHYDLLRIVLNCRLGKEISLKARAYSDEYIIDVEKKLIFSPGPDGESYTGDDIKLIINPEVLGLGAE